MTRGVALVRNQCASNADFLSYSAAHDVYPCTAHCTLHSALCTAFSASDNALTNYPSIFLLLASLQQITLICLCRRFVLNNRLPSGPNNGFRHLSVEGSPCVAWLDAFPAASVVYVSFGSTSAPSPQQMIEVAFGLADVGKHFLWAVRSSEADKIPPGFAEEHGGSGRGLVVDWSPQLEVLSHEAVGCFVTHCGWNSTLEGMSLGVPMVAVPQWTDQPTVAKYVEDVWGVGVRAKRDEEALLVRREEVVRCVREVMEGSRSDEIRRNAAKWREAAKAAVGDGNGSSNKSTMELINKYCSKAK